MKVVLLAGGFGTRISEESHLKPKPMIEIGGMPILWHIMKWYSKFGHTDFIICAGYKQNVIKEWFANYYLHTSDVTFNFREGNDVTIHRRHAEPWKVTVVDTGLNTLTGGRIKRIKEYIDNEPFLMTYGDGVANVNINELISFHNRHNHLATLTCVQPEGRYGTMDIVENNVTSFREKKKEDSGWINGGFMVLHPKVIDYIDGDNISFEREPLERMAHEGQLGCYKHDGFWQCMDTLRDKENLERIIANNCAPWIYW